MSRDLWEKILRAMLCMTRQCWEQGIVAQCLLETGREEELALVVHDIVQRQSADGRLCNVENAPAVTDSAFCIPAVLDYAEKTGNKTYLEAVEKNIQFLLKGAERAEDGMVYHMIHTKEVWADSAAYMPYALAKAGHMQAAITQMDGIRHRLYDKKTGLYFHIWDDETSGYKRHLLWGIGNGWILTGLMRLYLAMPDSSGKEKERIHGHMLTLLDTMLSYETKEHTFHDVLDVLETFTESETAAMTAYTIYRGIKEGILDRRYKKRADQISEALYERVAETGLICQASGSPDFIHAGTSVECQAHLLMMQHWKEELEREETEK